MKSPEKLMDEAMEKLEQYFETTEDLGDSNTRKIFQSFKFKIMKQTSNYLEFRPYKARGVSTDYSFYFRFKENGALVCGLTLGEIRAYVDRLTGKVISNYELNAEDTKTIKKYICNWEKRLGDLNSMDYEQVIKAMEKRGFRFNDEEESIDCTIPFIDENTGLKGFILDTFRNHSSYRIVTQVRRNEVAKAEA